MPYAKDFKCSGKGCKKNAEVFFGLADPDGEETPYCKDCVEKVKMRIFEECAKIMEKKW